MQSKMAPSPTGWHPKVWPCTKARDAAQRPEPAFPAAPRPCPTGGAGCMAVNRQAPPPATKMPKRTASIAGRQLRKGGACGPLSGRRAGWWKNAEWHEVGISGKVIAFGGCFCFFSAQWFRRQMWATQFFEFLDLPARYSQHPKRFRLKNEILS